MIELYLYFLGAIVLTTVALGIVTLVAMLVVVLYQMIVEAL